MKQEPETYREFSDRVSYQQNGLMLPQGAFRPDRSRVFSKVDEQGSYRPFYGDTVVYDLDPRTKRAIADMTEQIRGAFPECFAERLPDQTLHMTLHDLSASDDLSEVAPLCFENELKLVRLLRRDAVLPECIRMKTNRIVNMVDTALVMTLLPEDEDEWNKLEGLYRRIDEVRVCPYPFLTPHITMLYFNRSGFDEETARRMKSVADELSGGEKLSVTLNADRLYYQKFVSMKEYENIFALSRVR